LKNIAIPISATLTDNAISKIKQLVSGLDKIPAEKKFEHPFQFENRCKLLFASNHPLSLPYGEEDFNEKLIVVPCLNQIPKAQRDPNLLSRLVAEKDAVIRRAIESYKQLVDNNMVFAGEGIYTPEEMFMRGTSTGIEQLVGKFVFEHCVFDSEAYIHTQTLNDRFSFLFDAQIDNTTFAVCLRNICGDKITPAKRRFEGNNRNGYEGIRLKNDE
jgi:putative DNA primase/helicase